MAYLLDTGILLRLVDAKDPFHAVVRQAVQVLAAQQEELFITNQNVAEFWNVATRPVGDNGLGLPVATVVDLLENIIEPICAVLIETDSFFAEFKRLGRKYEFRGKRAHDARLVAMMRCWNLDKIVTLNDKDFRRYEPEGIVVVPPQSLSAAP
jgi:predicted nucleic acid-binding protein